MYSRIGVSEPRLVDGRLSVGSFLGLSAGLIFTALALFVLWLGFRFRSSWRRAIVTLVVAVLVASPNLLTLGIVIGDGTTGITLDTSSNGTTSGANDAGALTLTTAGSVVQLNVAAG